MFKLDFSILGYQGSENNKVELSQFAKARVAQNLLDTVITIQNYYKIPF